jgi:uridine kinase
MKPYVVAIAGGTCSGKSTLTSALNEQLEKTHKVKLFNMDSYFKNPTPTVIAPITGIEYPEHNHPDALKLDELKRDFDEALTGAFDAVLIEGLFALQIDWIREKADLKVFVDLKSDARLARRIVKHMKWGRTYDEIVNRYLDTVRFRHDELIEPTRWHADIVVNGTENQGAEVLTGYIESKIKESE